MKIIKTNEINLISINEKNKDNKNDDREYNSNQKLIEEFLKKENDYKLKIKELEKIIANYQ